jgi:lipoprotein-anchoring transpeptidase ErfK/SrfK
MPIKRSPFAWTGVAGGVAALVLLASCGTPAPAQPGGGVSNQPSSAGSATPVPTTEPPAVPVVMTANVKNGATKVGVDTLVFVKATAGALSKVTLSYSGKDTQGKLVKGSVSGHLAKDHTTWTANGRLEPAATYKLAMSGKNASDGAATTQASTFKTRSLSLAHQTFSEIYPLRGSTVGVGMPVILRFDVAVKNKKAFQKNLTVTSKPAQVGVWHWYGDREVHFRPKSYWKPGTKVSVKANLNGVSAGGGVYGQNSTSSSFKIGRSLVTKINIASDVAHVYRDGKLARTIAVTGGRPGWVTRSGTKLIMDKLYVTRMTNQMIGAKESYDLQVHYAMRITSSGEFLHAAPWQTGNLGRRNASHGCVGMSTANAAWLFNQALIGDPVVTTGTSRGLEQGNGYTDWDISWSQYKKGSAV